MKASDALDSGLLWVSRGFAVLPAKIAPEVDEHGDLVRLIKEPLCKHGHLQASRDPDRVRKLFNEGERWMIGRYGTMGVGLVPGSAGCLVVDADIKGGIDGPAAADAAGVLDFWPSRTASGGEHRWVRKPLGMSKIRNGNGRPWAGVDIRGDDGWVVAPGTTTPWGDWVETHTWPGAGDLPVLASAPAEVISIHLDGGSGGAGWGAVSTATLGLYNPAIHDDLLPPSTLAAHEALAEHWGMDPSLSVVHRREDNGDHYLTITRPGKSTGTSGTCGYIWPGGVWIFSSSWPGLEAGTGYDLADLNGTGMSLEEMEEIGRALVEDMEETLRAAAATTTLTAPPPATSAGGGGSGSGGSGTVSTGGGGSSSSGGGSTKPPALMVRMVRLVSAEYVLFVGDDAQAYAVPRDGGHIAEQITGGFVIRACWSLGLVGTYAAAASQAATVLAAKAVEGPRLTLSLRSARHRDGLVLDLADPDNARCVMITPDGWWLADQPPEGVYFRRSNVTKPLPDPERGGTYDELKRLTGFSTPDDERWSLIRGWLVAALLPDIPRPILMFLGPAGSAKTTRAWMVVSVLDPKPDGTLGSAFSKDVEDNQVKALSSYLPGFDNLGKINAETSDHIARMVTGEASERRKRYSDAELAAINYRRTAVMTAITMPPVQPDALARMIAVECGRVPESLRLPERKLWKAWHGAHPAVLGAVLDDVVCALMGLPAVTDDDDLKRPRMADYWETLQAVDTAVGTGLAETYWTAQGEVLRTAAEVDPFVRVMREWLTSAGGAWEGEPTRCWEEAGAYRFTMALAEEFGTAASWWPKTMAQFNNALARTEEPMSAVGITVRRLKTHGRRKLVLDYKPPE